MKRIIYLLPLVVNIQLQAQVGINTTFPKATLDVMVNTNDTSKADGIIAPRVKGSDLKLKDALYNAEQKGTIVFVTEPLFISETSFKTTNITESGYYYFDGLIWKSFEDDTLENVVKRGNYSPKYISFIGSTAIPLRDGALGMNEQTYSMYFGNMNPDQTGNYNIGFGYNALEKITTSTYSTAVGSFAGRKTTTGNANSFFGDEAGANNITGHKNSIFGMAAAYHNSTGSFNSIFGYKAGQFRSLGNYNILIGNNAGSSNGNAPVTTLGSNNVLIGSGAGFSDSNISNKLIIHSNNTLSMVDYNSMTNEGVFSDPNRSSLANALVTGDFVERWFKLNGKLIVNPSYLGNGNEFTKIIVAKTDGTFGWEDKTTTPSIPIPPTNGNYILKSINGTIQWITK
ncbi:hypothetical protein SAMN05421796_101761 [Chryseobacterium piscicola]|uniref:Trimeric autotransporter adhesin YadA-like head domain-containing protein n=1 Tax=Chryseobacterium piscicola TaxID=551459 RepID=A0A1N7KR24_9FLAO|nr:hypothetical protein [Chryseobacterium piscicola]PQA94966.1 hypothetical protein B0A70_06490 [Chryseobacterium piscicola]SIS64027.1 hypothetical protein SAMN05421796_101761 [Chryseobacterium piscicola]